MIDKPLEIHNGDQTAPETLHKPVANSVAVARGNVVHNNPMSAYSPTPTPTPTPAPVPAPRDPASVAIELRLNELLGTPTPDDWNDPIAIAQRVVKLETTACDAGESMIELLVRLKDERARDVHLHEHGCVLSCTDAMLNLHRALVTYTRDTLRHDGEDIARDAITRTHGAGVTALTMRALAELRVLLVNEMRSLP
jgi:hypothetical protein